MKNAASKEAIDILLAPEQVTSYYKGKQVITVPPLAMVTILESNSLLPAILIPALSSKFQEFDRSSATVTACTILRPVLVFFWVVHHKKVPPTVLGLDHSQDAKDWSSKLHLSCILPAHFQNRPPPFVAPPPLGNPPQDQSLLSLIAGDLRLLEKYQMMRKRKMA